VVLFGHAKLPKTKIFGIKGGVLKTVCSSKYGQPILGKDIAFLSTFNFQLIKTLIEAGTQKPTHNCTAMFRGRPSARSMKVIGLKTRKIWIVD
jgi:hypothetical protein